MRTHPKIKKAFDAAKCAADRHAIAQADRADQLARAFRGNGSNYVPTKEDVVDHAHAILLKEGITRVARQPIDVFLMRFIRDHHNAPSNG